MKKTKQLTLTTALFGKSQSSGETAAKKQRRETNSQSQPETQPEITVISERSTPPAKVARTEEKTSPSAPSKIVASTQKEVVATQSPSPARKRKSQKAEGSLTEEQAERKRANVQKFIAAQRAGGFEHTHAAKNPGSKDLPVGHPQCLEGLSFLVTGQLESMSRNEAHDFIRRHGGIIKTNISGKTNYCVVGENAGESKMHLMEKHHTKKLSEDDLINLVVTISKTKAPTNPSENSSDITPTPISSTATQPPQRLNLHSPATPAVPMEPPNEILKPATTRYTVPIPQRTPANIQRQQPSSNLETMLWADKYRPATVADMVTVPQHAQLRAWLASWKQNAKIKPKDWKAAALLSGLPGVGKTTAAHAVGKECGYDVIEWNASDKRNKSAIQNLVADMSGNTTLTWGKSLATNTLIIMDEVDGCDRGGVAELIQIIHKTKLPIIAICNDRFHTKVKSLVNHCLDLRFQRPARPSVAAYVKKILTREGYDIPLTTLEAVVEKLNNDMRNVLNTVQMWLRTAPKLTHDQAMTLQAKSNKDHDMGMFDAPEMLLSPTTPLPVGKQQELYYQVDFLNMFVAENYVNIVPSSNTVSTNRVAPTMLGRLELLSRASDSICLGDICDRAIHYDQRWALSNSHVFLSCTYPSSCVRGRFEALGAAEGWREQRLRFPTWLGSNSTKAKFDRALTCIAKSASNPVEGASGSRYDIRMDYFPLFVFKTTQPLAMLGKEGIRPVIEFMDQYHLGRDDWEIMQEYGQWRKMPTQRPTIETSVKAAFTRTYNAAHTAISMVKGATSSVPEEDDTTEMSPGTQPGEELSLMSAGTEPASDEEAVNLKQSLMKDTLIVQKRAKPAASAKRAKAKPAATEKTGRGRGAGRGRGKKEEPSTSRVAKKRPHEVVESDEDD